MSRLQNEMFACGISGLPPEISCGGQTYSLEQVFKHDFFACTGRYVCTATGERSVLKMSRLQPFLGISLAWLGHFLRDREFRILSLLEENQYVPKQVRKFGRNGLLYKYIEGNTLDEKPKVGDSFFDDLALLVEQVHSKNICYMDLNKRGNIVVGRDQKPYLIDFQISLYFRRHWSGFIRKPLQREDFYHLLKHKRHFRSDLLTSEEKRCIRRVSPLIRVHRFISYPFRQSRRWLLAKLYDKHIIRAEFSSSRTPENDPMRFSRRGRPI
ncbi:MAG: hypothetical protein LLF76_01095 [Planctomycetaceae bacterium]|nr:hypothetical protein [Planctomycetaceae bacterium]